MKVDMKLFSRTKETNEREKKREDKEEQKKYRG